MMARGINKVILIGTLGKDPDIRQMPSGGAVANFSMATNETWKDKQTGEKKEATEWHKIVLFGKVAEIAGQYLKKGSTVYIEGRLQTRKYQDKDGADRYSTEIVGSDMQMMGGKAEQSAPAWGADLPRGKPAPAGDDFDDEIPF